MRRYPIYFLWCLAATAGCDPGPGSSGGNGGNGASNTGAGAGETATTSTSGGATGGGAAGGGNGGTGGDSPTGGGGNGGGNSTGGGGNGGGNLCTPGETMPCYSGPPATQGVGICQSGAQACDATGALWGPCEGEILPAIEDCASAADESCDGEPACTCAIVYQKEFPVATGTVAPTKTALDGQGHLLIAGAFSGTIDFGFGTLTSAGGADVFLLKVVASTGGVVWAQRFGGPGDDTAVALAGGPLGEIFLSVGGTIHLGADYSDPILLLDPSGTPTFAQSLQTGNLYDSGRADGASFDADGSVYLTGHMRGGTLPIGTNNLPMVGSGAVNGSLSDGFVAKLENTGLALWYDTYGSGGKNQRGTYVRAVEDALFMFGSFEGGVTFGSTQLGALVKDNFVSRQLTADGSYEWAKDVSDGSYAGQLEDFSASAGGLAVMFAADLPRVRGLSPLNGASQWAYPLTSVADPNPAPSPRHVAIDNAGNIAVSGFFQIASQLGSDTTITVPPGDATNGFFLKLTPAGTFACAFGFGGAGDDALGPIAFDPGGDALVTGTLGAQTSLVLLRVGP